MISDAFSRGNTVLNFLVRFCFKTKMNREFVKTVGNKLVTRQRRAPERKHYSFPSTGSGNSSGSFGVSEPVEDTTVFNVNV